MGRERKRASRGPGPGGHAKERHKKLLRNKSGAGIPVGLDVRMPANLGARTPATRVLNARPEIPNVKSKHLSYFELVENKDKKKKLVFKVTESRVPPPGFEFVPVGNPELTSACKELSREQDAMIFIVSTNKSGDTGSLSHHVNRVGNHIREAIVEQARRSLHGHNDNSALVPYHTQGLPEPIPESQRDINEQADKAIRDLFPRIPNTDRQMIIEHAFKKGANMKRGPLVGLAQDISLSRRVQLAVLAHIRHVHTRYDQLLRETSYANARKAVESLCLDILVKWRGDEETGRDQLDEIFREVIVISDSEDDDGDEEGESSAVDSGDTSGRHSSRESSYSPRLEIPSLSHPQQQQRPYAEVRQRFEVDPYQMVQTQPQRMPSSTNVNTHCRQVPTHPRDRKGFSRYRAALEARWGEARQRVHRQGEEHKTSPLPLAGHQLPPPVVHHNPVREEQYAREFPVYLSSQDLAERRYPQEEAVFYRYEEGLPPSTVVYREATHLATESLQPRREYVYDQYQPPVLPRALPPETTGAAPGPSRYYQTREDGSLDTGLYHREPVRRHLVNSEQTQDFLVPSVEPQSSPTVPPFAPSQFMDLTAPPYQQPVYHLHDNLPNPAPHQFAQNYEYTQPPPAYYYAHHEPQYSHQRL